MRPTTRNRIVPALAIVLLCAACTSGGSTSPAPSTATATGGAAIEGTFQQVVRQVLPAVVRIATDRALGSGVVFDDRGDIVTNAHVLAGAETVQVSPATGGSPLTGRLLGVYPPDDLAVIQVRGAAPPPARFADSSKLAVGQIVLAMGNPLGLTGSVTEGIVSAVGRTVSEPASPSSPGTTIADAVQTSAAINPGNSGGALVDTSGQVVGIPTMAATDPELGGGAAPGIGFAIPSNTVTDIAGQIVRDGKVTDSRRAALGIAVETVVGPDGRPAGAGVVRVDPGGPADKAGIKAGDVITAVGGTPVADTGSLAAVLAKSKPGDTVPVQITRAGKTSTVRATLGQLAGG
ncbi:S1C family serine protease [Kutzneria kofuensis]|uniref:Putative serine protease PepD n=1 Tax=Kutzneria kofuensis TaxID=103725 RepID=A0A7W9KSQ1_9PSEU|nr:trypsin-like peptidase domain-containing protein [Kutzneria kofuensis]MBB5897970.1 putative serine protease PepD [Kutzneria kofuensis]